jgi:heat-inducible transcriptional repressor
MTKGAEKRRDNVLKIIVNEYVATALPVASEAILRNYDLGVSPATIRNDMACLEEEGYIARLYTSSGGIPLDKAYRHYVENLSGSVDLPAEEQRQVRKILGEAVEEYDRILRMAASIMAHLVGNAAVVTYPRSNENRFRHLELVAINEYMALVVLILSNAVLRRFPLSFSKQVTEEQLEEAAGRLNREFIGLTRKTIKARKLELTSLEKKVCGAVMDIMEHEEELEYDSSYLEGLRLMLGQPEFTQHDRMLNVLELMEAKGWLRHVIDWQITGEGVKVIIGGENHEASLHDLSLVFSKYGVPDQLGGTIGIIGPKRMDYGRAISAVNCMSDVLSEMMARVRGED